MKKTISESLFETICTTRGIGFERILERETPTPDYEILLGGKRISAEIKQIDLTEDDLEAERIMASGQVAGMISPAQRIRRVIASRYRQIKVGFKDGKCGILILYNNAGFLN